MKNFKRIIASASAAVMAATAMFTAIPASAEMVEKEIAYNGPSDGAFALENDGKSLRLNIFNEWMDDAEVKDIDNKGSFAEKVAVTFTVDGLSEDDTNDYSAYLSGSIGSDGYWGPDADGNTVENEAVAIEGNGEYTAEFLLSAPADTISCLIISTNIDAWNYDPTAGNPEDTGITFTVNKITTMVETTGPDLPDGTLGVATLIGSIGATQVWGTEENPVTDGSKTANIDGDAQYEVVWNVTDGGTDSIEFLAVQIPGLSSVDYADLSLTVDGVYVDGKQVSGYTTSDEAINLAYTEGGAMSSRIYLIDAWSGTGVADLAADTAITKSLKVVFTVSGTGKEGTTNVSKYEKGDINRDGTVDLYDAIYIAKYIMGMIDIDEEQNEVGDLNGDGTVDLYDAIAVAKIIMGIA